MSDYAIVHLETEKVLQLASAAVEAARTMPETALLLACAFEYFLQWSAARYGMLPGDMERARASAQENAQVVAAEMVKRLDTHPTAKGHA